MLPGDPTPREPCSLEHENTERDVDEGEQRCPKCEGKTRIDSSRHQEGRPANRGHGNHNSPPSAEQEPHEKQRRNHRFSLSPWPGGTGPHTSRHRRRGRARIIGELTARNPGMADLLIELEADNDLSARFEIGVLNRSSSN